MPKTEEEMGFVEVIDGKYKIRGKFHIIEKNQPIFDKNENVLLDEKFSVIFLKYIRTLNGTIVKEINRTIKSFRISKPEKAYIIRFYKGGVPILQVNLSKEFCNDDEKCDRENGENEYLCPQDCEKQFVEKRLCGNGICEAGETQETCCIDCGCPVGMRCVKNKCVSDKCGNGVCDVMVGENYNTCPQDCQSGSKDGYCDRVIDGKCDPDCKKEEDLDCVEPKRSHVVHFFIMIVIIVLVMVILLLSKREQTQRYYTYALQ